MGRIIMMRLDPAKTAPDDKLMRILLISVLSSLAFAAAPVCRQKDGRQGASGDGHRFALAGQSGKPDPKLSIVQRRGRAAPARPAFLLAFTLSCCGRCATARGHRLFVRCLALAPGRPLRGDGSLEKLNSRAPGVFFLKPINEP